MNLKQGVVLMILSLVIVTYFIYPVVMMVSQSTGQEKTHLSAYKDDVDDVSEYRRSIQNLSGTTGRDYDVKSIVSSPNVLNKMVDPARSLYIVTGVERKYDSSEITSIINFIIQGGSVVICDDKGYANDLADLFSVTYYTGMLIDDVNYDDEKQNINFTVINNVYLPTDNFEGPIWMGVQGSDGWPDQDVDQDGRIDEDPMNRIDDDEDNDILTTNGADDDHDGITDEPREGYDENPLDDDRDGADDEELYDGIDNDHDGLVDEDTKPFRLIYNDGTGILASHREKWSGKLGDEEVEFYPWFIGTGSTSSFIDMNNDGEITIPDSNTDINQLADVISTKNNPITLIMEVVVKVKSTGTMGRIMFISDANIFTNDMVSVELRDENGKVMYGEDNKPILKYDNLAFGRALVLHMLPNGGSVLFDESRHAQDPFIQPIVGTIWTLSVATSNPLYASCLMSVIIVLVAIVFFAVRTRDSWIHVFSLKQIHIRESLPKSPQLKKARLRHLIMEKARLKKSLSPEEFATLKPEEINKIVGDPQLVELINNPEKVYTDAELMQITAKIKNWG